MKRVRTMLAVMTQTAVMAPVVPEGSRRGMLGWATVPPAPRVVDEELGHEELADYVRPVYEHLDERVRGRLLDDLAAVNDRVDAELRELG